MNAERFVLGMALLVTAMFFALVMLMILQANEQKNTRPKPAAIGDWRPPVEQCPERIELWECVRGALYTRED